MANRTDLGGGGARRGDQAGPSCSIVPGPVGLRGSDVPCLNSEEIHIKSARTQPAGSDSICKIGEAFVTAKYGSGVVSPDMSRVKYIINLPIGVTKVYSVFGCRLRPS